MNGKYTLTKRTGNTNEVVAVFKSFQAGAKALREAGEGYFLQGPRSAWWFDEVAR